MKKVFDNTKKIYAFGTKVVKGKSLIEVRKIIEKHGGLGFQYTEDPYSNAAQIQFVVRTKKGDYPVRLDIPAVYRRYKNGTEKYLVNESYRCLILLLKSKFALIDLEPIEKVFFLDFVTAEGRKLEEILLNNSNLPKLLEKNP